MEEKVMIGCPVRNRAWVLPDYLNHILRMDFPLVNLEFCFVVNDCSDQTLEILQEFALKLPGQVRVVVKNHPHPGGYKRGYYSLSRLADLRNLLLQEFLYSSCSHLFSVDSDILVPPHALNILLQDQCDIVSALVCNGHEIADTGVFNILNKDDQRGYYHVRCFPPDCLFAVDCTGAAYLIAREVIEQSGVRYRAVRGAEDIGFCEEAHRNGKGIFCDSRVECIHLMKEGELSYSDC